MRLALALLLIWAVSGLYTWGSMMADLDWRNANEWKNLNQHSRDETGFIAVNVLLGPLGAIVAAFGTNFNQHGWELWEKNNGSE
jgi:hypothetical protein